MNWPIYISIFIISVIVFYKTKLNGRDVLTTASIILISLLSWQSAVCVIFLTFLTTGLQSSKLKAWIGIITQIIFILSVYVLKEGYTFFKLGLSYYALQNIGILLLCIRYKPQKYHFKDLLFANIFFAKFISGPILLPNEIIKLKVVSKVNSKNLILGVNRIVFGIFKKIVLADNLHIMTNAVFNEKDIELKAITIIFASLFFTVEMYLNFSAYTDMAIGIAKLFNIKLKENFKIPLRSNSVSEYWKKTHISLIEWLTQNLFYPISFKLRRKPKYGVITGILVTFILSGLWHGIYTGFFIWGILNGIYLSVEHLCKKSKIKLPKIISWSITMLLISFSNLFFISKTREKSLFFVNQLLKTNSWNFNWERDVFAVIGNGWYLEQQFQVIMILILVLIFFIREKRLEKTIKSPYFSVLHISTLTLLCFLIGNLNNGAKFIYMQF